TPADAPGRADLAWASFPCQDLSLAGARGGLQGARSGAFFAFVRLLEGLAADGRAPRLVGLENVKGLLTSSNGADFSAVIEALAPLGYQLTGHIIDAEAFTPQSRPRLFLTGALGGWDGASTPRGDTEPADPRLARAVATLPPHLQASWRWVALPAPPRRNASLIDILEPSASGLAWRTEEETARLLELMAPAHRQAVESRRAARGRHVGTVFRRTRHENGRRVQRAEARFDGVAGCLRTPAGGSSRQLLLDIEAGAVRSRFLTGREAARLMGLPDDYQLPRAATAALHLLGDGVCAPAVGWLARTLFEPALARLDAASPADASLRGAA
ncbi:MAG: DNA (cytosine-5-)-methyltransferase, partial [Pseudomonadota bacterium]